MFSTGMPVSTSSLVMTRPERPLSLMAVFTTTMSSHPQRRGRPVVAPNSPPISRMRTPGVVQELGRKRTASNPRGVSLDHAENLINSSRANPCSAAGVAGHGIG